MIRTIPGWPKTKLSLRNKKITISIDKKTNKKKKRIRREKEKKTINFLLELRKAIWLDTSSIGTQQQEFGHH